MSTFEIIVSLWLVLVTIGITIFVLKKKKEDLPLTDTLPPAADIPPEEKEVTIDTQQKSEPVPECYDAAAIARRGFISAWSKIKFFLQLRDAWWSIPLWFFFYYESAVVNHYLFGGSVGVYDPSFIQPVFLAGCYVLAAMAIWQWVLWFYFRTLHRYIWGKHRPKQGENGITINYSKKDFKELSAWQKILISFLLFAVVFGGFLAVSLKLM